MSTPQDLIEYPDGLSSDAERIYKDLYDLYRRVGTRLRLDRLGWQGAYSSRAGFQELMAAEHIIVSRGYVWFPKTTTYEQSTAMFDALVLEWQNTGVSNNAAAFIHNDVGSWMPPEFTIPALAGYRGCEEAEIIAEISDWVLGQVTASGERGTFAKHLRLLYGTTVDVTCSPFKDILEQAENKGHAKRVAQLQQRRQELETELAAVNSELATFGSTDK